MKNKNFYFPKKKEVFSKGVEVARCCKPSTRTFIFQNIAVQLLWICGPILKLNFNQIENVTYLSVLQFVKKGNKYNKKFHQDLRTMGKRYQSEWI